MHWWELANLYGSNEFMPAYSNILIVVGVVHLKTPTVFCLKYGIILAESCGQMAAISLVSFGRYVATLWVFFCSPGPLLEDTFVRFGRAQAPRNDARRVQFCEKWFRQGAI